MNEWASVVSMGVSDCEEKGKIRVVVVVEEEEEEGRNTTPHPRTSISFIRKLT